jgi:hypothetical protein
LSRRGALRLGPCYVASKRRSCTRGAACIEGGSAEARGALGGPSRVLGLERSGASADQDRYVRGNKRLQPAGGRRSHAPVTWKRTHSLLLMWPSSRGPLRFAYTLDSKGGGPQDFCQCHFEFGNSDGSAMDFQVNPSMQHSPCVSGARGQLPDQSGAAVVPGGGGNYAENICGVGATGGARGPTAQIH